MKELAEQVGNSVVAIINEHMRNAHADRFRKDTSKDEAKVIVKLRKMLNKQQKEVLARLSNMDTSTGNMPTLFKVGNPYRDKPTGQYTHGGLSRKARLAKESHLPCSKNIRDAATKNEYKVAKAVGGTKTEDNHPFDVIVGKHKIEVKTIVRAGNDKITMHKESLLRKTTLLAKEKGKGHTVVFDNRNNKLYYKAGFGSFRLTQMTELKGLDDLKKIMRIKP